MRCLWEVLGKAASRVAKKSPADFFGVGLLWAALRNTHKSFAIFWLGLERRTRGALAGCIFRVFLQPASRRGPFVPAAALALVLALALPASSPARAADEGRGAPDVLRITVDGAITPVAARYIEKGIAQADSSGADLLVIVLDTPGGLMTSTRQIVKALLSAPVPVAVFVAPPGARAASAGVFITMAANVAAMAPGTNIGAAHPVGAGGGFFRGKKPKGEDGKEEEKKKDADGKKEGIPEKGESTQEQGKDRQSGKEEKPAEPIGDDEVMGEKVLNDTVAFIRSVADRRGRNADWAERAVRESVSITEKEAVDLAVIDFVAEDLEGLLEAVEGRTVTVGGEERVLATREGTVRDLPMDWPSRVLSTIADPNVAYILMMLGIWGIFFELANPGVILPGVLGGIFLILAFFALQVLPINSAGLLLIVLALVLFVLEIKVVSYGMLSVGGALSLFLGSAMLFDSAEPYLRLSLWLILGATGATALFFAVGIGIAIRIQRRPATTGMDGLVGETGTVSTPLQPEGKVKVHGEIWNAVADAPIGAGERVRVVAVEGMLLKVEKMN